VGTSGRPFNAEVAVLSQQDRALERALTSSRRVGSLLLKQEEEELQKIDAWAGDLLKKHRSAWLGHVAWAEHEPGMVLAAAM
jgi:hypothetical protein